MSSPLIDSIYYQTNAPAVANPGPGNPGPWRPPQWSRNRPAVTITAQNPKQNPAGTASSAQKTVYVLDSTLRAEHDQNVVVTMNPVQTGAAMSDHAYVVPPRLTVEFAMSDAMQSYTVGQWNDSPSKSVSAWQTLIALKDQKLPVSVATRLQQYDKMMIVSVRAEDTKNTRYGLRATVTFVQVLTAQVEATSSTVTFPSADSAFPQTTDQTLGGQTQTQGVPDAVTANNNVANAPAAGVDVQNIPPVAGAGEWTSSGMGPLGSLANEAA